MIYSMETLEGTKFEKLLKPSVLFLLFQIS